MKKILVFDGEPIETVQDAINAIVSIVMRFDLQAIAFTPYDIRETYEQDYGRPMTDAQWQAFADSWWWRERLMDVANEAAWEIVSLALADVFDADGDVRVTE